MTTPRRRLRSSMVISSADGRSLSTKRGPRRPGPAAVAGLAAAAVADAAEIAAAAAVPGGAPTLAGKIKQAPGLRSGPQPAGLSLRPWAWALRPMEFHHGTQRTTDSGKARTGKDAERASPAEGGASPGCQAAKGD